MTRGTGTRFLPALFRIGIVAKGIDGALEILGGALLFFTSAEQLRHVARILTLHELTEDPNDLVANYVWHAAQGLSPSLATFGAVFMLVHGAVKVGLVSALLLRQRWAYPAAIAAFLVLLAYQLSRYAHTRWPPLLLLSALDVLVILLTWHEYRRLRASGAAR